MKIISFFGSIAVGKTTAGRKLSEVYNNVQFLEEELNYNPFLEKFYLDMKRWGFHSSISMLSLMMSYYTKFQDDKEIYILDNGVEELIAYTNLEYEYGILSDDEYKEYKKMYENVIKICPKTDLYVYFKCDIDIQIERMKKRNRNFEQTVDKQFLIDLNKKYEEYVSSIPQDKLIVIETNEQIDIKQLYQIITK